MLVAARKRGRSIDVGVFAAGAFPQGKIHASHDLFGLAHYQVWTGVTVCNGNFRVKTRC